jgi:flagellin
MRINNNMSAVITNKQLLRTENNLTKSMERLSSGLKINHAKDNPAGMAISNKMQAQIDALDRASSNASDGTSVLQIADGALNETSAILQRMRELSVQAANGTNSLEDKQAIQDEIEALKDEVNRISKDTEYNSKSLLDGSLDTRVYTDNANVSRVNVSDYVNPGKYEINIKTAATKATDTATDVGINSTGTGAIGASGTISINGSSVDIDANDTMAEVYEKIRAAAEVGEAEMKTDDGTFTGLQASRYGSSAALVITFSGKEGVSTTKDFATALGYTTDLTTDAKTGTMTYDAANDRFGYDFTGVSTGDYYYYYVVDGTEELDAFNSEKADYSGQECSVCHFKKANVSVEASLSQYAMDYNDNNVLSVKLTAKDGEGLETSEIAAITADLSELGLNREFAIDPTLMEQSPA